MVRVWASLLIACLCNLFAALSLAHAQSDPLPSWKDTAPKQAIIAFVQRITKEGTPDSVPVDQRIAAFDNDGTLWVEQPMYVQLAFILDRVRQLAPDHPDPSFSLSYSRSGSSRPLN